MVEYALLVSHNALGTLATQVNSWMSSVNWTVVESAMRGRLLP